jgi:hypothetical protein
LETAPIRGISSTENLGLGDLAPPANHQPYRLQCRANPSSSWKQGSVPHKVSHSNLFRKAPIYGLISAAGLASLGPETRTLYSDRFTHDSSRILETLLNWGILRDLAKQIDLPRSRCNCCENLGVLPGVTTAVNALNPAPDYANNNYAWDEVLRM